MSNTIRSFFFTLKKRMTRWAAHISVKRATKVVQLRVVVWRVRLFSDCSFPWLLPRTRRAFLSPAVLEIFVFSWKHRENFPNFSRDGFRKLGLKLSSRKFGWNSAYTRKGTLWLFLKSMRRRENASARGKANIFRKIRFECSSRSNSESNDLIKRLLHDLNQGILGRDFRTIGHLFLHRNR